MLSALLLLPVLTAAATSYKSAPPAAPACLCSSGIIPMPLDVEIAADPANLNPIGFNVSAKRRLDTTFHINGVLCQPLESSSKNKDGVQLLVHGQTYSMQYWNPTWGGYTNYSYIDYSCSQGISSFAYDDICAGLSSKPANSTDCQMPGAAKIASSFAKDLMSGRISKILTGQTKKFQQVVGVGHSLGSAILDYSAIVDGKQSPFAGLFLSGHIHDPNYIKMSPIVSVAANQLDPARWPGLDSGYVTTPNLTIRATFYGPDLSFNPRILDIDELTKDVGSHFVSVQIAFSYAPAVGYRGPVVELVGALDKTHCLNNNNTPCDQATLQASEKAFWPDSKDFTMIVIPGVGHSVNLEYSAPKVFSLMTQFFNEVVH